MILLRRLALLAPLLASPALAQTTEPSRPAFEGCQWEQKSDLLIGLEAWVQRCDFGFRQVELVFDRGSLAEVFSDGGEPDPVVQVMDLLPDEAPVAAVQRLFEAGTEPTIASRCDMVPFTRLPVPEGVERYTFAPDADYALEIAETAVPDEIGPPRCGDWGETPDGIQYFEVQAGAPRVMFVMVGQEEPLFDEQTLKLLPLPDVSLIDQGPEACCGYKVDGDGVAADFLLETCSVPGQTAYGMIPNFDCQSYVLATLDTLRAVDEGICLPPVMTAGAALALLGDGYSYEADGQRPAAAVLTEALRARFAC